MSQHSVNAKCIQATHANQPSVDCGFSVAMFVKTMASFRSGQWSISWFKFSVSDLLFSIRDTHAQPKSESGVHKQLDGISFLCSPPLYHLLVLSNTLGLPLLGPPSRTLRLYVPCSILHFQQRHVCPRRNADRQRKTKRQELAPTPLRQQLL